MCGPRQLFFFQCGPDAKRLDSPDRAFEIISRRSPAPANSPSACMQTGTVQVPPSSPRNRSCSDPHLQRTQWRTALQLPSASCGDDQHCPPVLGGVLVPYHSLKRELPGSPQSSLSLEFPGRQGHCWFAESTFLQPDSCITKWQFPLS